MNLSDREEGREKKEREKEREREYERGSGGTHLPALEFTLL